MILKKSSSKEGSLKLKTTFDLLLAYSETGRVMCFAYCSSWLYISSELLIDFSSKYFIPPQFTIHSVTKYKTYTENEEKLEYQNRNPKVRCTKNT